MLINVIDTETTGIVRDYKSPDAPYIASITAIIYDTEKGRVQSSFNTMIQPFDTKLGVEWTMPPEAGAVNGLDDETLATYGLPIEIVLPVIMELARPCELIVGHNVAFDVKMLASALYRADMMDDLDTILEMQTFCTMQESKHIVQAKNTRGHLKAPKLTEAYEFFFERPLDNSHSANADTVATLEIYLALQTYREQAAENEVKL